MNNQNDINIKNTKRYTSISDDSSKWVISINSFIIDIRKADYLLQLEALEEGLIPYLPTSFDSDEG